MKVNWKHLWYILFISLPVALIDQLTKLWALTLKGKPPIVVFDSWWNFIYAENRGALFGLGNTFSETMRVMVFVVFSSIITGAVGFMLVRAETTKLQAVTYALIIGGAAGNLVDRLLRGYVIDFVDWHIKDMYHWATFNVADAAIVVAMGLLIIALLKQASAERFQ